MKKVLFLMTVSLLFIYGCEKEGLDLQDSSIDQNNLRNVEWQLLNIDGIGQSLTGKSFSVEDLQGLTEIQGSFKAPSNHANGHFNTQDGNTISFSAGGNGGNANFNIKGVVNFKGDAVCATVEGNQAVLQVVVTSVGELPEGFPDILGWTFLYLFEDNGEGFNAPSDRYWNFNLVAPFTIDVCDSVSPSFFLSIFEDCPCDAEWTDTAKKSDQIQIN